MARPIRTQARRDLVHALPKRSLTPAFAELSLPERVWILHQRGLRNFEIARELGISDPAVRQAVRKLNELATIRTHEAHVDVDTHESFSKASAESKQLFDDVAALRRQGIKPAQIARQLHYFKHTIKAVCRWLNEGTLEQQTAARELRIEAKPKSKRKSKNQRDAQVVSIDAARRRLRQPASPSLGRRSHR